ncbi:MAG: hypothetical protein R3E90_11390 [Marinicella sp.]|nr:hypothetical protein [Xanthomonadales bacterium]
MRNFVLLSLLIIYSSKIKAEDIFTNQFEYLVATRISNFNLRDPHTFSPISGFGCFDITDSLNSEVNVQISTDSDGDGNLDLSFVTQYYSDQPAYLTNKSMTANLQSADCTAPQDTTTCSPTVDPLIGQLATNPLDTGSCLLPIVGTTTGYVPAIITTGAPCHSTVPQNITINLGGINLPLENYQQALRYQNGITTDQGLHLGFISEAVAETIIIPASIPVIGGQTFASLLPGGMRSCSTGDDRDIGPDGQTSGWWLYFNSESGLIEFF